MKGFILEKRGNTLVAIDDTGADELARFPNGKRVVVSMFAPVNEKHYRLWWALANKVVKSGAYPGTKEQFKHWILSATKRYTPVADPETGAVFYVGSLAMESFTDPEFREWFDLAIKVVCEKLLARPDWAWLRNELIASTQMRRP